MKHVPFLDSSSPSWLQMLASSRKLLLFCALILSFCSSAGWPHALRREVNTNGQRSCKWMETYVWSPAKSSSRLSCERCLLTASFSYTAGKRRQRSAIHFSLALAKTTSTTELGRKQTGHAFTSPERVRVFAWSSATIRSCSLSHQISADKWHVRNYCYLLATRPTSHLKALHYPASITWAHDFAVLEPRHFPLHTVCQAQTQAFLSLPPSIVMVALNNLTLPRRRMFYFNDNFELIHLIFFDIPFVFFTDGDWVRLFAWQTNYGYS